jgi:hypothetical protein
MNEQEPGLCYIDPTPAFPELIVAQAREVNGGAAISVVIVTCGVELGVDAIVDIGVAIIVISC